MNRVYRIIEKSIGITLIIFGTGLLFASLDTLYYKLDILYRSNGNSFIGISFYKFFKDFHLLIIISVLAIISGICLLKSKMIGWLSSIIIFVGIPITILIRNLVNPESDFHNPEESTLVSIVITFIVLLIGLLLMTKPFKNKYNPKSIHWKYIIIAIGFMLIDVLIFK